MAYQLIHLTTTGPTKALCLLDTLVADSLVTPAQADHVREYLVKWLTNPNNIPWGIWWTVYPSGTTRMPEVCSAPSSEGVTYIPYQTYMATMHYNDN
jgi:hypothetical protein